MPSPLNTIPDRDALLMQLAGIGGNEPRSSYIEIRALTIGDFQPVEDARCWMPLRERRGIAQRIAELAPKHHVYVGGAPRVREGRTVDDIERVWSLWCDCDSPESVEALRRFRPPPSNVWQTRPERVQAQWPLRQPIPPHWAKRANQRLALALGSDRQAVDAARILRPIGSLNHKTTPPSRVVCLRCELDVFLMEQVVGHLDDVPEYTRQAASRRPGAIGGGESSLAGLVRIVREAAEGTRNDKLNWASFRAGEHVLAGSLAADDAERALHAAAVAAGLGEAEAQRTIHSGLSAATRSAAA